MSEFEHLSRYLTIASANLKAAIYYIEAARAPQIADLESSYTVYKGCQESKPRD